MIILELLLFLITMQAIAYFGRTEGLTSRAKLLLKSLVGGRQKGNKHGGEGGIAG